MTDTQECIAETSKKQTDYQLAWREMLYGEGLRDFASGVYRFWLTTTEDWEVLSICWNAVWNDFGKGPDFVKIVEGVPTASWNTRWGNIGHDWNKLQKAYKGYNQIEVGSWAYELLHDLSHNRAHGLDMAVTDIQTSYVREYDEKRMVNEFIDGLMFGVF